MAKDVLVVLVLSCVLPLVLDCELSSDNGGGRWKREAAAGGRWKREAAAGGRWKREAAAGGRWKREAAAGGRWKREAAVGGRWKREAAAGGRWKRKAAAGGRWKRQAAAGGHNHPIPVSLSYYTGVSQNIDSCRRNEVEFPGGSCQDVLTRGPCGLTEFVLLDQRINQGYCAPRLCAPDMIFVFSDQLCHDPRDTNLCPPGRRLYYTAYGTPICQCPSGTYEAIDSLYEDVCEPILGKTRYCPYGQVLWFRDFSLPWECLPDPCGGKNLNRGPNDAPFVPSAEDYGKCYQLGQMSGVCPAQTWYSLALERLQGVCSSLQDAGYEVFDPETLAFFNQYYRPLISDIPVFGSIGGSDVYESNELQPAFSGQDPFHPSTVYGSSSSIEDTMSRSQSNLKVVKGDPIASLKGIMESLNGAIPNLDALSVPVNHNLYDFIKSVKAIAGDLVSGQGHHRSRRQTNADTTIRPPLGVCRAGAERDQNLKCQDIVIPSASSNTGVRPPVPAQPPCPPGQVYNAMRRCTSDSTANSNNGIFG